MKKRYWVGLAVAMTIAVAGVLYWLYCKELDKQQVEYWKIEAG